jgi:protein-tyrosine-phosphatase/predicted ATP-grasp superfamily ATP-dependent carboligase
MDPADRQQGRVRSDAALVLDGHSRAALETLQSLGRVGVGVDVAADGACLAWKSRYCQRQFQQPNSADGPAFLIWLEKVFDAGGYRLVVPSTEASLRCLLLLPESHAIRRAAVLASNHSQDVALSKQLTLELAHSLGVPVPASRLLTSRDEAVVPATFPVVLKPVTSLVAADGELVGVAPVIVTTHQEWSRQLDRLLPLCPVLEQEYVTGCGVGIECLYRHGTLLWHFQHERLHELPLTGGGSSYRRSVPVDAVLLKAATRLLDSLHWHGAAMVEFKGSADRGYRLMEINPRLWGSLALPIRAGVDFPRGLWCLAAGQDPGPQPRYRWPCYARNLRMDFDWLKENLRADHANPLLLTRPKLQSLLEYGRPLIGRESWDHFDARDWRVWGAVLRETMSAVWHTANSILQRTLRPHLLSRKHRRVLAHVGGGSGSRVRRILFVCYGNICRSPLAELYARRLAPDLETASAGFHHTAGRTAPEWYQAITAELGVDISLCRSRRIDAVQVAWAELILLADLDNLDSFEREFPEAVDKATMLGFFLPTPRAEIKDPYNLDAAGARTTAREVLAAVDGLIVWSPSR